MILLLGGVRFFGFFQTFPLASWLDEGAADPLGDLMPLGLVAKEALIGVMPGVALGLRAPATSSTPSAAPARPIRSIP